MNVNGNKKLFFTSSSFQLYKYSFKSLKNLRQFLKTQGTKTSICTKTELVNIKNNAAAVTATNISNKRNIKIYGST